MVLIRLTYFLMFAAAVLSQEKMTVEKKIQKLKQVDSVITILYHYHNKHKCIAAVKQDVHYLMSSTQTS